MIDLIQEWEDLHEQEHDLSPEEFNQRVDFLRTASYINREVLDTIDLLINQWHVPIRNAPTEVWEELHRYVKQFAKFIRDPNSTS